MTRFGYPKFDSGLSYLDRHNDNLKMGGSSGGDLPPLGPCSGGLNWGMRRNAEGDRFRLCRLCPLAAWGGARRGLAKRMVLEEYR